MKKVSVVIPVYNSEKTITEVVERIQKVFDGIGVKYLCEIILVNDCSRDSSKLVCRDISKKYTNVTFISLASNFGQHCALMAGFSRASGEYIVCLDDDLQNPPEEIPQLLKCIDEQDYDVVIGAYDSKKHSVSRNLGSKINELMTCYLINKPKEIKFTSFFVMREFVVGQMLKYHGPYPYIPGLILRTTKNIGTVKIQHLARQYGESNYSFKKLISLWANGFTNFSIKPLRIASVLGLLFSGASFLFVIWLFIWKMIAPDAQIGWTSVMVAITFFGGIQMFCVGMLGEYIGRMYLSVNETPQYVIKEEQKRKTGEEEV